VSGALHKILIAVPLTRLARKCSLSTLSRKGRG
jgi:hypothetical protein